MVSMPYFNSGGAIANSLSIEQKLMQTANSHAENIGSDHIEYRDNISRDGMPVRSEKVNMILSLPDTHEALWHSFTSKLRSQIRRAQREETQVIIGGAECLDDFYTVFAQNMRDLGTPVYGKSFFRKILQQFDAAQQNCDCTHGKPTRCSRVPARLQKNPGNPVGINYKRCKPPEHEHAFVLGSIKICYKKSLSLL